MKPLHTQFKDFHVFKKFKELISAWWNIDIFLIEKNHSDFLFHNETDLNNKVVKSLMGSDLFKGYFLQALKDLTKENDFKSKKSFSINWKQTDLNILAVPLILNDHLKGYIVATGFLNLTKLETLRQSLGYLNFSEKVIDEQVSTLKPLKDPDKVYIEKFLSILSEESFSLIQEKQRQQELIEKIRNEQSLQNYGKMIGKSPSMQFLYDILNKIKTYESPILIRGESGTGRQLLAETIHAKSPRAKKPFFYQNCSAFSGALLDSELFGHKKGAFKGSANDKKGLFEIADGGTIFLDEIGDISLELQSKLLRTLQDGTFFSLEDPTQKKSNVRLLVATHKNLEEMIQAGSFKEDLYYMLNLLSIKVAPLRERKEDIPLLVDHFLKQKNLLNNKSFSPKAMERLCSYPWPGNVRELANEIESILLLTDKNQDFLTEESLSKKIRFNDTSYSKQNAFQIGDQTLKQHLHSIEKDIIIRALKQEQGNKTKVAKLLGSSRTSIILKVKEYKLNSFEESS